MIKRRDFMKLLGAAAGGLLLPNCDGTGGSGDGSGAGLPNGYDMTAVFSSGGDLPEGASALDLLRNAGRSSRAIDFLSGGLMMNDQSEIIFHCKDNRGALGWYAITMDYSSSSPRPLAIRKLMRQGDDLPDGGTVRRVGNSDTNSSGEFVTLAETSDKLPVVYHLAGGADAFERVAGYTDPVPGANGTFGGNISHLNMDHHGNILLTGHYADSDTGRSYDALFYLHEGRVNENGKVLLRNDSLVPDADGVICGIGIPCLHHVGNYVVQAQAAHPPYSTNPGQQDSMSGQMDAFPTCLIQGRVDDVFSQDLLAASTTLDVSPRVRALPSFEGGDLIMGPRVGPQAATAYVVHQADGGQVLFYSGKRVAQTGYRKSDDTLIQTICAPVISETGELLFLLGTDHGMELWARADGQSYRVLSAGVFGDYIGGKKLNAIVHGTHPTQTDSLGRICFLAEFEDNTTSLIVGVPV